MPISGLAVADKTPARWPGLLPHGPICSSATLRWRKLKASRFDGLRCWELDLPAVRRHYHLGPVASPAPGRHPLEWPAHRGRSLPDNAMLTAAGQDSVWHRSTAASSK
jgi:hypothetical protein